MTDDLRIAVERLCAYGRRFDRIVPVLKAHRQAAVPVLVRLLAHQDPGWRKGAATAFARMRATPRRALPGLLRMLKSQDATELIVAISALDWLPADSHQRAVPAIKRLLLSDPVRGPRFTMVRAHLPRAVGAHFLGLHGGAHGLAALSVASRRGKDPILHHIKAALEDAKVGRGGARQSRRRTMR